MPVFQSSEPSKEEVQSIVKMKEEDRVIFKAIGKSLRSQERRHFISMSIIIMKSLWKYI